MIDFKYLMNPEKYHAVPPRLEGENDEQYKARLKAYVQGIKSQQAKIDELQARIDKAVHILTYTNHASTPLCNELRDILKGNKDE